jgi:two-component system chemotaxis sensor kinase CheA
MATDLSQFHEVFFEEAGEHLAAMESLLLGLDLGAPDADQLNGIFRSAHSIKGGSGMFGFADTMALTHELETLLDRLRRQELALTSTMVDAFLEARDVIKAQLDGHRAGLPEDESAGAAMCARLKALASGGGAEAEMHAAAPAPRAEDHAQTAAPAPAPAVPDTNREAAAEGAGFVWRVELTPEKTGVKLDDLIELFGWVGAATCEGGGAAAPPWRILLTTKSTESELRELIDFAGAPVQVAIAPRDATEARGEDTKAADFELFEDAHPAAGAVPPSAQSPAAEQRQASHGRRATDAPDVASGVAGRRADDKVVHSAQAETTSIRVSVEKVDKLINLVGELVITQAMLTQISARVDPVLYEKLLNGLGHLERSTRDLQDAVMSIRMVPISSVFNRFPRLVRDLAGKLGKQVELKMVGEGTELDKGLIEKITDPLTHLVRNSLDHGIELPDERSAAGKPEKGTVTLRAFHQGGNVIIEVGDDGRGLDRSRILAKAHERGIAIPDTIADGELWQLIFEPGFSTAATVTDVSGRGVGMDVVKRNIQALGGRVEIATRAGEGTRMTIRLPLTLAILDGLSIAVGGELFIVPLAYIVESLQPAAADVKTVSGRGRVVHVRGEYLPLVALHEHFNLRPRVEEVHQGIVVILETEGRKTAIFVDELVGQHQVVIKSLETNYRRVRGVSGATIMGDGKVALILDPVAIARERHAGQAASA